MILLSVYSENLTNLSLSKLLQFKITWHITILYYYPMTGKPLVHFNGDEQRAIEVWHKNLSEKKISFPHKP